MRQAFTLVALVLATAACRTPALYTAAPVVTPAPVACAGAGPEVLRVASFNVKYASGHDLEAVADFLRTEAIDLVALQEVDRDTDRNGHVDTPARLAELAGGRWFTAFGAARAEPGGEFGLAILSRAPFGEVTRHELADAGGSFERRIALRTTVCTPRPLEFVSIHADVWAPENAANARSLLDQLPPLAPGAVRLIAGDLNATPGTHAARIFSEAGYRDLLADAGVGSTPTFRFPPERLDYFFGTGALARAAGEPGVLASELRVVGEARGSDHLPIAMTLRFDGRAAAVEGGAD